MGHKISKEQIDPGVKDHIMSFVGDIADLETEVNTDIISAVNSLMVDRVDNAENMGKLANAIGEPVTANHSVDEVVEGLGEMLSTFKTNMMNSGVVVESSDKFKQLIDKIKGLTEGEGNKGIQFAEGETTVDLQYIDSSTYVNQTQILDFTPSIVFVTYTGYNNGNDNFSYTVYGNSYTVTETVNNIYFYNSDNNYRYITVYRNTQGTQYEDYVDMYITTSKNKFDVYHCQHNVYGVELSYKWYAIGVGEEDTTLRDSLAAILTEEGVDVTEEDDMASLINKTDVEFNDKNNEMNSRKQGLVDTLLNKSINANNTMTWEELYTIVSLSCNSVMTDVVSLHCGGNQTVIIKNDGTVWGTGANTMGQLGFGNTTNIEYFKQMSITDIKQLEHGYGSIMIIKNDGTVWACGNNSNGQLGLGLDITSSSVPPVTTFGQLTGTATVISLGNIHSMIAHNGELYYAGNGAMGQFGTGGQHGSYNTFQKNTKVSNVEKVFCGGYNTIILKSDGSIMGCGNNVNYQLGLSGQQILNFTTIDTGVIDVIVNCNTDNTMYIKTDNTLWGMGQNSNGILGLGNTTTQQTKVKLADNVRLAALGANHSIIVKYDGTVWVSGSNTYGQLGLGDNTQRTKFTQLTGIDGNLIKQVGCNQNATHILLNNGILLNCGQNNYGQLGKDCRKFAGV